MKLVLMITAAVTLIAGAARATDDPTVAAGRIVAQRHCAACHDIAAGKSPLEDAPPFARLHSRYGAGGLAELLGRGMIKDYPRPLEEGSRMLHPRMPAFPLDDDEVAALAAYMRTFEAGEGPSSKRP